MRTGITCSVFIVGYCFEMKFVLHCQTIILNAFGAAKGGSLPLFVLMSSPAAADTGDKPGSEIVVFFFPPPLDSLFCISQRVELRDCKCDVGFC